MIRLFTLLSICMITFWTLAEDRELASGNISKALFSPNGKQCSWIAKTDRNDSLFIRSTDGQNPARELFSPLYQRTFYSWSPDSKRIACTSKQGRKRLVTLITVDSGENEVLCEGFNPVFYPEGEKILFFTLDNLCAFDLKTKTINTLSSFEQRQSFEQIAVLGENIYFSNNGDLWHATLEKQAEMLLDHKEKGVTEPFIQNPVPTPDHTFVYVSLITDGLYAHVTDNILGRYDLKAGVMSRLNEANSWTMRPDGQQIIYGLGGDLKIFPDHQTIGNGASPVFSPNGKHLLYLRSSGWDDPVKLMLKEMVLNETL